ncbi:MAG: phosphoribosylformylglycinamidine synthase subunit PurS [Candidatus Omnitrophota bacterium]
MAYLALIKVTLKKSVLDPQGKTVVHALETLGFKEAKDVRVGKSFDIQLETTDRKEAEAKTKAMCEKLLINPVIEDYTFELRDA